MTPGARVAAAIDVLDAVLEGAPAEKALTGWARGARYAGSKDRAAVRDHVFDALRRLRSHAARGGAMSGRGVMLGALREAGIEPDTLFTGEGHAPAPLSDAERVGGRAPDGLAETCDMPDWLWPRLVAGLGGDAEPVARALRERAPAHLRVNLRKIGREDAAALLAEDGVRALPHPASASALAVEGRETGLRNARAFREGLVELQDAASQAVVEALPLAAGMRVLDYCAGGGGKTLAMGALADLHLVAHDAAPRRMADLPPRAARAGLAPKLVETGDLPAHGPFDVVLCDAPCSGSGAWRRSPEGKWRLTVARLTELLHMQLSILEAAAPLVASGGVLAYATCSVLEEENGGRVAAFLARNPGWRCVFQRSWTPLEGVDGFFTAHLRAD